jgi:hypothetical protein
MQTISQSAAYVRSVVLDDQSRGKALFGLIGEHCGLPAASSTGSRVYELLGTPQTLETLKRAIGPDNPPAPPQLQSFLEELYRRDLIELSADS